MIEESCPVKMIEMVWNECNKSSIWSYGRLNTSMHRAVELAIFSGMKFNDDDFSKIAKQFRIGYWGTGGGFYVTAVKARNISACRALEKYMGMKPYIVKFAYSLGGIFESVHRTSGRLALGAEFGWDGRQVRITSMTDAYIIACSYYTSSIEDRRTAKEVINVFDETIPVTNTVDSPAKKYRLTREDLRPPKKGEVIA